MVATINSFHNALDCMNRRLENTCSLNRNEKFLKFSGRKMANKSSTRGCYSNQNCQKRAKPDRNEINQLSRPSKPLNSFSPQLLFFFHFKPTNGRAIKWLKQFKIQRNRKIQKQTHGRRCRKEISTDHTTAGRMHHGNGEARTGKRPF